ncbi:hypothetical protein [Isoptericola sp. NPDC057191]|uniref:hypothetical protein n=1 Tax=Isoptericola sp. NPDC057191 TaxID=3346041 RepID=UPI003630B17F
MVVSSSYDARLDRDAARTPAEVDIASPAGADAVAHFTWRDDAIGVMESQILYYAVLDDSAPPPPGLPRWPAPGEVWASPALEATPGADAYLARYGRLAGTIDPATLTDHGERIAYVGADDQTVVPPDHWNGVTHFGVPVSEDSEGYLGAALYQGTKRSLLVGLTVFGLAPAVVATIALTALGAEPRRRLLAQLRVIGATPRVLRRTLLRPFVTPSIVGATAVLALVVLSTFVTWPVPGAHLSLDGADYQSAPDLIAFAFITAGAAAATWAHLLWQHRGKTLPRIGQGTRPRPVGRRPLWLVALVADVAVTNWAYALLYPSDPFLAQASVLIGSALTVVILVPCIGILTSLIGRWLAVGAHRCGSGPALIGAREVQHVPRAATRVASVIAMAIVLAAQLQILAAQPGPYYQDALRAQAINQGRSVLVDFGNQERALAADITTSDRHDLAYIGLHGEPAATELIGDCPALTRVVGSCPSRPTPLSALAAGTIPQVPLWGVAPDAVVRQATPDELRQTTRLVAVAADADTITPDELTRLLGRRLDPPPNITVPLDQWVVGSWVGVDQARWYRVGGMLALLITTTMSGLVALAELERLAGRHRVIRFYGTRVRHFVTLGLTLVAVPGVAAAVLGAGAALGLAIAPTTVPGADAVTPQESILAMLLASVGYIVVLGTCAGFWIQHGRRHRPRR